MKRVYLIRQCHGAGGAAGCGDFAVVAHAGVICLFLKSLSLPGDKPPYSGVIPLNWETGRFYQAEI